VRLQWRLGLARMRRREEGSISVEFGLLVPVFLLLVFGIVDFGHAFYIKHVITNASREGARYGVKFQTDSLGRHIIPNQLNPDIQNYILTTWGLNSLLPADANPQVTPGGTGYTSGLAGDDLTVTVTGRKNWFVLGLLIPTLGSYKDISVTTDMKIE